MQLSIIHLPNFSPSQTETVSPLKTNFPFFLPTSHLPVPGKSLISKRYKQLMQLNTKKKKKNTQKMSRSKQTSLQRRHMDSKEAWGKIETSLIIRELWIKATMRYHLTLVRMAFIKMSINNKCWRWWEKKEPSYTTGENVNWKSHCREQ